ncbi:MAG: class II aldolase/adducin family protein [Thermodesulfobacteriota bacterium]|nr:class II aldolase/adducin family protein [Thermodesulfobacteriota bacterium]
MMNKGDEILIRLRKELAEFSRRAFHRGLVASAGGNMSVRVPGTEKILITPTGVSLGDVEPETNVLVNFEGFILDRDSEFRPSKETSFHLSVYQLRSDVGAIAHLHPPYATAYSNMGRSLPLVTISSRAILKEVPWVECALPGSKELCDFVSDGIKKYPDIKALLMKEHGILTMGSDIKTAYYLADLVEGTAKIAFIESNIRTT